MLPDAVLQDNPLEFGLLGPMEGRGSGGSLDLGPPQRRAVLAVLLLKKGAAVSADELVAAVWGADPPERAIAMLRTYASQLRATLEPGRALRSPSRLLVSVGDGYALRIGPDALDVSRFERSAQTGFEAARSGRHEAARVAFDEALALWRGTALAGVPGPFAEAQRERLAEAELAVREQRAHATLALGRQAEAVTELRPLVAAHPLRENLTAVLMRALAADGRTGEALAAYEALRTRLVDDLGIDPGAAVTRLQRGIKAGEPNGPGEPAHAPTARSAAGSTLRRPAQLPADLPDFTGRGALVAQLTGWLGQGAGPAVLSGGGGVGKTTLALHVAHRISGDFPDGQLFTDLRGTDPSPVRPGEVIAGWLRALGLSATPPPGTGQRAALLRAALDGKRVLFVLDNARDAAQVRPLLPDAPGCAVLVTSRSVLPDLPGALPVEVGVPPVEEALALFRGVVGAARADADPATAREVVTACGRLPLAVRIVAARLAARPSWTVRTLAARLADQRRRLDELRVGDLDVTATLHLSHSMLDRAASRALRLLAIPDIPELSPRSAAVILNQSREEAAGLCARLADAALLDALPGGRYRFHDLTRLYARGQSAPAERSAVLVRILEDDLATLTGLLSAPSPDEHAAADEDGAAAAAWVARERVRLLAIVRQAALEPGSPVALATCLVLAICACVDRDGARGDAEWAMAALMGMPVHYRLPDGASPDALPGRLSAPLRPYPGRHAHIAAQLQQACVLLEERHDPRLDGWTHFLRGTSALFDGEVDAALAHHRQALAHHATAANDGTAGNAMMYALMIKAYRDSGCLAAGSALAHRALAAAVRRQHQADQAFVLHELGLMMLLADEPGEAVRLCEEALDLARRADPDSGGNRLREGYALLRLAQTQLGAGRPEAAQGSAQEAVAALDVRADPSQRGTALAVLAETHALLGDHTAAERHYREAARLFSQLGLPSAADLAALADHAAAQPSAPSPVRA
ncbi:AfsR/SARP family transcriptional regulator [Actinomadura rupiterrae]|uniref:AfsR/SARP family transcriptional regulator n=1 Tax=Actinomadura rupiterrae TaxID=559627 RepID=UPI0020A4C13A|nr:AfsR/SARP family transcriptional regulator [Actinomadura rupiterrae]MCP2341384.1 DNA-binding SARP family transcriptional activator [Actinomadura rupiterrae]